MTSTEFDSNDEPHTQPTQAAGHDTAASVVQAVKALEMRREFAAWLKSGGLPDLTDVSPAASERPPGKDPA
ncbi:type II toxin-antitoxin system VapB family antitoxin [Micromonospora sp. NPDC018662]|uniref:type II toxin-antitoxin system VapB family antitoxin n=1 Tax=Micromonospora sp. NPDC018662 TaxID=3364238 RepID=UPI0037B5BA77